ncbi:universal stress protein [Archaeoglobus sp.]
MIEYVVDLNVLETLQMKAKKKMDEVVGRLKERGVNAKGFVKIGSVVPAISMEARCPSIEILDRAYCERVDAIVIPSKGKHAKRIVTIGSTALNVVRRSNVPVLVVKYDAPFCT